MKIRNQLFIGLEIGMIIGFFVVFVFQLNELGNNLAIFLASTIVNFIWYMGTKYESE